METRKMILSSLLLAIGFMLHHLVPGIIGSMKFDLMLVFIFISIILNSSFKNVMLTSLAGGILTALTTTFPGGQLPNIIDKIVTGLVMYLILRLISSKAINTFYASFLSLVGTIISGSVFLISALLIVGLPVPFNILFFTVVIPTAVTNSFITVFIYQVVKKSLKLTQSSFGLK